MFNKIDEGGPLFCLYVEQKKVIENSIQTHFCLEKNGAKSRVKWDLEYTIGKKMFDLNEKGEKKKQWEIEMIECK